MRLMFTGRLQETAVDLKTKETQIDIKIEQEREKIEGKVRLILAREVTVFGFEMMLHLSTCRYHGKNHQSMECSSKPTSRSAEELRK